uniref:Uncharacterized protein n=1 Tax=Tetradesmus obliquus TaxID=3088 RepID=A0A383WKX2_TETOB
MSPQRGRLGGLHHQQLSGRLQRRHLRGNRAAPVGSRVQATAAAGPHALRQAARCQHDLQHRAADGSISERQGGKPSKRQAAAARGAAEHKAMPTRFYTNLLLLLFWQAQLMVALTQLNTHMLASKAAGAPNWFHPGSLTSGAQYSNTSPAMLATQAAYGTLAAARHLYTGGRPAECCRLRWGDTGVLYGIRSFIPARA